MIEYWPGGDLSDAVGGEESIGRKSSKRMTRLRCYANGPEFADSPMS